MQWLTLLELESRRGDWVRSKNAYSINKIMDKLDLQGPTEKNIALSVWNDNNPWTIFVWVHAKLINGAWKFRIIEGQNVLV